MNNTTNSDQAIRLLQEVAGRHCARIQQPYTLEEICEQVYGNEYNAELMLQHLLLWCLDKSRNILTHSRTLELQRDEAREERNTEQAKLDTLEQLIVEMSHPTMRMLVANIEDERAANKALSEALEGCLGSADSTVAAVTAELAVERVARKALTKALMICIRYADSGDATEQAHAALALAAKLP